ETAKSSPPERSGAELGRASWTVIESRKMSFIEPALGATFTLSCGSQKAFEEKNKRQRAQRNFTTEDTGEHGGGTFPLYSSVSSVVKKFLFINSELSVF